MKFSLFSPIKIRRTGSWERERIWSGMIPTRSSFRCRLLVAHRSLTNNMLNSLLRSSPDVSVLLPGQRPGVDGMRTFHRLSTSRSSDCERGDRCPWQPYFGVTDRTGSKLKVSFIIFAASHFKIRICPVGTDCFQVSVRRTFTFFMQQKVIVFVNSFW